MELNEKTKALCAATGARVEGIEKLIEYYEKALGWTQAEAEAHIEHLFADGTIEKIVVIGKGEEHGGEKE